MKFLLFAALIGFCSAVYLPTVGRHVFVGDEKNIAIKGLYGNQYTFTHYPTGKFIDIVINGVDTPAKKIHINDQTCHIMNLEGFSQIPQVYYHHGLHQLENIVGGSGYLLDVLKQYQGPVSEEKYQDLLETVHEGVEHGQICHIIYHLLAHLDEKVNEDLIEKYLLQQQLFGQELFGKQHGVLPLTWAGQQLTGKFQPNVQQWTYPYVVNPAYQQAVWGQHPWTVHHYPYGLYQHPSVYTSGIKSVWGQYPYGYVPHGVYQHGVYGSGVEQQYGQEMIPVY